MGGKRGMRQHSKVVWPGFSNAPAPRSMPKIGRNDPCPCGSGEKYKECHQKEGQAYLDKLAKERDKEELRIRRERMKEQGVPWFKRLFLVR